MRPGFGGAGVRLSFLGYTVNHIIATWGYLAVFGATALEGFGLFFVPGETTLIAAAIYAGQTGKLEIAFVLTAAFLGAVLGDNFSFYIGQKFGFRLLRRYGHYVRLNEKRLKFVQYLFLRYGHPIVFVGRFVMLLRAWESFMAGADAMPWKSFAPTNAAAILVWVWIWGFGAYWLGRASTSLLEWLGIAIFVVVSVIIGAGWVYFHRHEEEAEAIADRALPGPLRSHRPADLKPVGGN
jgi:membrane protein DedA with SNARE-associated domain